MIGIILSGKFINPELKQIFGEIVPSQIPLGNKSILEIQVDFLDKFCESIYLFSPEPLVNDTRITHIQSTQYQKLDWFSVIKLLLEKKPFKQKKSPFCAVTRSLLILN